MTKMMSAGKDVSARGTPVSCWEECKLVQHCREQYMEDLQKTKGRSTV